MKMKYCPQCGAVDMKALKTGLFECERCKYVGEPKEGGMDEINRLRTAMKYGSSSKANPSGDSLKQGSSNELKEKLQSMKGRKSEDFEIL